MGVCPVCNCKTDELDFTAHNIGGKEYKICSFCHRQLKGFDNNSEPSEAQLKWLWAVIGKDIPDRDEFLKAELEKIPNPKVKTIATNYLADILDGKRDFRF